MPGSEMKGESAPDLETPGFEPGTQWSEVECYTARPAYRMPGVVGLSMHNFLLLSNSNDTSALYHLHLIQPPEICSHTSYY